MMQNRGYLAELKYSPTRKGKSAQKIAIREHSSTSQEQTQKSPTLTLNESIKKLIFCAYFVPIDLRNARKLNEKTS